MIDGRKSKIAVIGFVAVSINFGINPEKNVLIPSIPRSGNLKFFILSGNLISGNLKFLKLSGNLKKPSSPALKIGGIFN